MELCDYNVCTGCGVCWAVCNREAISFISDELGFKYPVIDNKLCVECGLCRQACPTLNPVETESVGDCYIAWAKDDDIHYESSSGGLSSIIGLHFIQKGGFVVGCKWDPEFNAVMDLTESISDLKKMQGSKYVHSYFSNTVWKGVERRLKDGKTGVIIGLPCQTAALKQYTQNDPSMLFCDLLCHGGCSPRCFSEHIHYIRKTHLGGGKIDDVKFRGGQDDCHFTLWYNGKAKYRKRQYSDSYFYSFMKHSLFRNSCYTCQYAGEVRSSDITIADYWGIDRNLIKGKNILNGTNLVIVHSDKGRKVWEEIGDLIESYKRPIEEAIAGNDTLREPTNRPPDRDAFLSMVKKIGFEKAVRKDPVFRHNNDPIRRVLVKVYSTILKSKKK